MNKPTNLTRHGYELLIATGTALPELGEKLERYASRKLANGSWRPTQNWTGSCRRIAK
jgi:hypothetical protein